MMARTWTIATATREAGKEVGNGNGGKSNGNGSESGGQATATREMARVTVTARRLAGHKEGKAKGCNGNGDSN